MIAALPMYDRAETAPAHDRLWTLIQDAFGYGPKNLTRDADPWDIWQSPDLLLAQTCGLPFRARLHERVTLVATPDYGLPDTPPGYYHSVIVARAQDDRDLAALCRGVFAFNEALSQSGWAAPLAHLAAQDLTPDSLLQTGAHRVSAQVVAEGRASFAALDAVSFALMQRHDPFTAQLRVVERTAPTPGLPLITAHGQDAGRLHAAIEVALMALSPDDRSTLHLTGLTRIPATSYLAQPIPPAPVI
ncbi:PhnD/SsuA/transferrin family substrate-binding protein [Aliiroseovarius subalbicans]|uniref:phosphate/phosphite/phosphonate ABC transporter substrate-binding protein n=1 Tax=Aliiroseovarius subalbicans TaxID=2925840 RepID=UPI001F59DC51|nr:PhnD/SsuA/transferrin family substrate-binding protein [Aliiroseovarius subalbicans]MCI2397901.1 PhnD/SsuA/transferrin family substrate-binding protein [Aliiroseovarius subalbicans]